MTQISSILRELEPIMYIEVWMMADDHGNLYLEPPPATEAESYKINLFGLAHHKPTPDESYRVFMKTEPYLGDYQRLVFSVYCQDARLARQEGDGSALFFLGEYTFPRNTEIVLGEPLQGVFEFFSRFIKLENHYQYGVVKYQP